MNIEPPHRSIDQFKTVAKQPDLAQHTLATPGPACRRDSPPWRADRVSRTPDSGRSACVAANRRCVPEGDELIAIRGVHYGHSDEDRLA
jgi:hypothetical protein